MPPPSHRTRHDAHPVDPGRREPKSPAAITGAVGYQLLLGQPVGRPAAFQLFAPPRYQFTRV